MLLFYCRQYCLNSTAIHATNSCLLTHSALEKTVQTTVLHVHVYCAIDMSEMTSPDKSYKWYLIMLQGGSTRWASLLYARYAKYLVAL